MSLCSPSLPYFCDNDCKGTCTGLVQSNLLFISKYSNVLLWRALSFKSGTITSSEQTVWVTAELLVGVEIVTITADRGPVFTTGRVKERNLDVVSSISLEISIILQPPSDLSTEVVSNGAASLGIDEILFTGIKFLSLEFLELQKNMLFQPK